MSSKDDPPLRVALLGAGIFASTAHAPVLQKYPDTFDCVAVWSRRKESAEALANTLHCKAFSGDDDLENLLKRQDVEAIIMALPLDVQPIFVPRILQSGKHLLSEKPIAPTVATAKPLVDLATQYPSLHWSVAENFRYEPAWIQTAHAVQTQIGRPFLVSLIVRSPLSGSS